MRELSLLNDDSAWQQQAACATADPTAFTAPGDDSALAVCKRCPVIVECGLYALEHRERGVWGGARL